MCCFFQNRCCERPCYCPRQLNNERIINRYTPVVQPITPNPVASFLGGTVTDAPIVLTTSTSYPLTQTDIVLNAGNTVVVGGGTYLIKYLTNATSTDTTVPSLSLAINGVTNTATTRTGTANGASTISGEYLVTLPAGSTIGLLSNEDDAVTYANNQLIIQKV